LGSLATGLSASWLGIREALLVNGVRAILAQALIGRHWRGVPLNRNYPTIQARGEASTLMLWPGEVKVAIRDPELIGERLKGLR
jgi:hypothetical protein